MGIFVHNLLLFCSSVLRFLNPFSFIRVKSSPRLINRSAHINCLPEECLLAIFDRIPLSDLMRLDQICHQWAMLLPSATARRHSLVLIIGGYRVDTMSFNIPLNDDFEMSYDGHRPYLNLPVPERETSLTLHSLTPKSFEEFILSNIELTGFFDILYHTSLGGHTEANFTEMARLNHARLTGQLATYFSGLFPNVNTLLVIHPECFEAELQSVIALLGSWPLVNLKLWIHALEIDQRYVDLPNQHPIGTLLCSINYLQASLQQLTLNIEGVPIGNDEEIEFTFPQVYYSFIRQLKVAKLYLGSYDADNLIWQTVDRLDRTKLRYIGLGNRADLHVKDALNPQYAYAHKVRQFYEYRYFETVEQLGEMCLRFNSLNMLEIYWQSNITFTELVAKLASLIQLTYLNLFIYFEDHPENAFVLVDQVADDLEEARPISLPQVKILKFFIKKRTHDDFESFSPNVFPSVESIMVDNVRATPPVTECIICRPNVNGPHNLEMAKQCDRLLIGSLRNKFATNSSIRIYPDNANVTDTDTDTDSDTDTSDIDQLDARTRSMVTSYSKEKIALLVLTVVGMFIFHVYDKHNGFSKKADILIYSNITDQNLKQCLNGFKFYMMVNAFTYFYWNLVRFVCLAYITWHNDNSQVKGRKIVILNVLKLGSYATALLLPLVTGLVSYNLINAISFMSSSDDVAFGAYGFAYLLFTCEFSFIELVFGMFIAMINANDNGIELHFYETFLM